MSRRLVSGEVRSGEGTELRQPSADCRHCRTPFARTHGNQRFCPNCREQGLRRRGIPRDASLARHASKMRAEAKKARATASGDVLRSFWANLTEEQRLAHRQAAIDQQARLREQRASARAAGR